MATVNATYFELPPLPEYTLQPLPPLLPWLSDGHLTLALPVLGYWILSGIYHFIDVYDLFPHYRLHTPAEVLKRNHVSRWEVCRDVIVQQLIQTLFGLVVLILDEEPTFGKDAYNVAWYARNIRLAQRAIPIVLGTIGLNPSALATKTSASHPMLASALAGGRYPGLLQTTIIAGQETLVPAFAEWELLVARTLYTIIVPVFQFFMAIALLDTWEYFVHRAMHMNKWLYVTLHSRHHRLYVPYAYGALYNHPLEGLFMDTLGTGLAYLVTGMTVRQSMVFFTFSTIKTVDDHCGYAIPWDPLQLIASNNAAYHDIHHQSWGIKSNFEQPFFTFWDRFLNTQWKGDVTQRYEKSRRVAQQKLEQEEAAKAAAPSEEPSPVPVSDANARPQPISTPRSSRKKSSSISQSGNLKDLRNKVNESLHGRGGAVLGLDSGH